ASRPAGVQDVEPMRFVSRKQRRSEGIDDGLARPVSEGEEPCADVEAVVGRFLPVCGEDRSSRESDSGGRSVKQERHEHQLAIAPPIGEEAEEDNRDTEARKADADSSKLALREPELPSPITHDRPAHREADAGGDKREETGPEKHHVAE